MNFHILTLFPEMVLGGLNTSIIGRAVENGLIGLHAVNIRDYTLDKHGKVDDYPYGGGAGMLIQAQPVFDAYQSIAKGKKLRTIYVTPQGKCFDQKIAKELSKEEELVFLCGHYEGIDERVLEEIVTDHISIGDYVLTGGELPAMVMIDAIARLVPGVLNNEDSAQTESFHNDLLEYPQYSRPVIWHEKEVPAVLLSGNHRNINEWRLNQSIEKTKSTRPDLYAKYLAKQKAIQNLSLHKRDHIHMIELLRRGNGEILYQKGEDSLLFDLESGSYLLTATNVETAKRLIEILSTRINNRNDLPHISEGRPGRVIACQEFATRLLCDAFDTQVSERFCQACYTKKEPLPVRYKDIRRLNDASLDHLCVRCPNDKYDKAYLRDLLQSGSLYGAYKEDRLIGFIGLNKAGGMDLLFVEEDYRGMGIATSLESYLINRLRELDQTPFCQIPSDQKAAIALQEKLGLYFSANAIRLLKISNMA